MLYSIRALLDVVWYQLCALFTQLHSLHHPALDLPAFHPPPLPFFVSPSSSSLLRFILLHFRPPYHYTLFHSDSTGTVWVVRGSESADRLRGDRRGQVTARSANCDWVIVPTGALCYAMYLWQLNGLFACMLSSLCLFSGS
jgi:hypothetical protein